MLEFGSHYRYSTSSCIISSVSSTQSSVVSTPTLRRNHPSRNSLVRAHASLRSSLSLTCDGTSNLVAFAFRTQASFVIWTSRCLTCTQRLDLMLSVNKRTNCLPSLPFGSWTRPSLPRTRSTSTTSSLPPSKRAPPFQKWSEPESRCVPGSSWTLISPSSPLVQTPCSSPSTICTPSLPPSFNTQAFQQALTAAHESLTSHPSLLHSHSTPPGSDPSSSDSDFEHTDIFHDDNDDDMSTTTALVDVKAGLPEDFSGEWRCQAMNPRDEPILQYVQNPVHQQTDEAHSSQQDEQRMERWLLWRLALQDCWCHHTGRQKDKELIVYDFEKVFLPTDKTSRARAALADLHMEGSPFKGDFHGFRSAFELEAGKSGVVDENILKDMLRQAVLTDLAF